MCVTVLAWSKKQGWQHEGNKCCRMKATKGRERSAIIDFIKLRLPVLIEEIQVTRVSNKCCDQWSTLL